MLKSSKGFSENNSARFILESKPNTKKRKKKLCPRSKGPRKDMSNPYLLVQSSPNRLVHKLLLSRRVRGKSLSRLQRLRGCLIKIDTYQ